MSFQDCPDEYKAQRICDEAVDYCLAALKFIHDWYVTSKLLENFHHDFFSNNDIFLFNEDFIKVTFIANQMHILAADLHKINLDENNNFDARDPDIFIHVRLNVVNLKYTQHLKKDK